MIVSAEALVNELEKLYQKNKSCIFRGHPSSDYPLQPKAFRPHEIEKNLGKLPATDLYRKWCLRDETQNLISLYDVPICHADELKLLLAKKDREKYSKKYLLPDEDPTI